MNSPKPFTEIVGIENKEMTMASIPNVTDIQEPSSAVKPGTFPNDTKSNNNDDDEVRIERRNNNAHARTNALSHCIFVSWQVDTTAHPLSSVASRFMNVLHSPPARRSIGKNIGDLKRPAEVTPVPNSTAKRSKYVTPKRIAKLAASEPVSSSSNGKTRVKRQPSPKKNFFQDVYDLLEQSTAMNPDLIRWTEDGTAFICNDKNIVKLSQWLTKFGTYIMVEFGSACCRSFSSRRV
jgi:hypothetical protein